MDNLERLRRETNEPDDKILEQCLESAKSAILSKRFPFGDWPDELEKRHEDLQFRCAVDLYNKRGAQGQLSHSENGISRTWGAEWISKELLDEVTPYAGVVG